ncbi:Os04g0159101 [Oryza sativa Japonica Group]|uniref:Os04g0159101 protein n=1 Tax=Oryza sativa subsp. japonica TaxID=39947 RepID=A0A0P0W757_ORYSJ|nr:Os04g0159101 [Oryza sativa Japonica Group]
MSLTSRHDHTTPRQDLYAWGLHRMLEAASSPGRHDSTAPRRALQAWGMCRKPGAASSTSRHNSTTPIGRLYTPVGYTAS